MNDSDIGYAFEWEQDFLEWIKSKKVEKQPTNLIFDEYPQIKKDYSENFVLNNFFDENNEI